MLHFGEFQTNKNWFHFYTLRPSLGRIGLTGKHAAKGEDKKGPGLSLTFVSGLVIMNLFNSLIFQIYYNNNFQPAHDGNLFHRHTKIQAL